MKKIKEVKTELGEATINLKSGQQGQVPIKTTYTYYEDGTNDCNINILEPLKISGKTKEIK